MENELLSPLQVLRKVLGGLFLPSTAIFHWLEDHAQIRLSILLTYLFGESILFVHLLTWLDRAWVLAGCVSHHMQQHNQCAVTPITHSLLTLQAEVMQCLSQFVNIAKKWGS